MELGEGAEGWVLPGVHTPFSHNHLLHETRETWGPLGPGADERSALACRCPLTDVGNLAVITLSGDQGPPHSVLGVPPIPKEAARWRCQMDNNTHPLKLPRAHPAREEEPR